MQGGKSDLLGLLKVSISTCPLIKPASQKPQFRQNNSTKQSKCVIKLCMYMHQAELCKLTLHDSFSV